jgi:hypothetical protein
MNEELQEQTDTIAGNIKYIEDNTRDYDDLQEQVEAIANSLGYIQDKANDYDYEAMEELTGSLASNLRYIQDKIGDYNHDELEKQTGSILANLATIANDETDLDRLKTQLDRYSCSASEGLKGSTPRISFSTARSRQRASWISCWQSIALKSPSRERRAGPGAIALHSARVVAS